MLVEIGKKIVSTDIFSEQFTCDLNKCKGACCVKGNGGAPLSEKEVDKIQNNIEKIKPYMSKPGIETVNSEGVYYLDEEDTPACQAEQQAAKAALLKPQNAEGGSIAPH